MILVDSPRWPAHGTLFGHLVSDESLEELHAFARAADLPARGFDHDHYDVPQDRYPDLIALGATQVSSSDLLRRLVGAGLRVRTPDRTPTRSAARMAVERDWARLLPQATDVRDELLRRWAEPHRRYHDVRHLAQCLTALDQLGGDGPVPAVVKVAAWFHDAVHAGRPGADEEGSAALAEQLLAGRLADPDVAEVARLVLLTIRHDPTEDDLAGRLLVDADLSVLGQNRGRYHVYVRDVREEYRLVDDELFRAGRLAVIEELQGRDPLYRTRLGRRLWQDAARRNLAEERSRLRTTEQSS